METAGLHGLDPLQRILIAQLAGDPLPAEESMDELFTRSSSDPMTTAVLEALQRRREREELSTEHEPVLAASDLGDESTEYDEQIESGEENLGVSDILLRLYEEVSVYRARNIELADALGACPKCWGEKHDKWCPICRKRGSPGGRVPIEGAFLRYVKPAIERRNAYLASRQQPLGTTVSDETPTSVT